jgi:biotin carboxyl carrier protein
VAGSDARQHAQPQKAFPMKIKVRIQDELFDVEIGDLRARPVIAMVEGERIELWPEAAAQAETTPKGAILPRVQPSPAAEIRPAGIASQGGAASPDAVRAPIPGVITNVAIQPGSEVARGDEICSLEAMKMKNIIRSPKAGKIAAVHVTVGQSVKHGDILAIFEAANG